MIGAVGVNTHFTVDRWDWVQVAFEGGRLLKKNQTLPANKQKLHSVRQKAKYKIQSMDALI